MEVTFFCHGSHALPLLSKNNSLLISDRFSNLGTYKFPCSLLCETKWLISSRTPPRSGFFLDVYS